VPEPVLPDPALIVLVGASGSGKSTWAGQHYRSAEVVSSDALRSVVGSGEHDLEASVDAFDLLDRIVAARLRRGLTTVVDTLGLGRTHRRALLEAGRASRMPCVAVVFNTPPALARERNRSRDRSVPATVLTTQLARAAAAPEELADEGWDVLHTVSATATDVHPERATQPSGSGPLSDNGLEVILQLSRFPWGSDPSVWLRDMAMAASSAGFAGIALMDHLIQIPQVDRAWEPIPEPFVTLGMLAGLGTGLRLGTLCTPATFRPAGVLAKTVATLDVLSGGRTFVGVGAGWWEREHAAYGLPFPTTGEREDLLEQTIETMRALWATGTKPYTGQRVSLPETTCYPRPVGTPQVIVGGSGPRRTLRTAARLGDACNLPSDAATLDRLVPVLHQHCLDAGRDPAEVAITVLDLPVVGGDREDVWARVERLRGRTAAPAFAKRRNAGTVVQQRDRYARLAERGIRTIFMTPPDLTGPDDVLALDGLTRGLSG
jgi:alkanesulfonate monooxygenase SsuD/methylene tetrahydromethanopterin reductase-like flavin-dependent oxidoreductase (luciferase family)/predicted kinase